MNLIQESRLPLGLPLILSRLIECIRPSNKRVLFHIERKNEISIQQGSDPKVDAWLLSGDLLLF